MYQKYSTEALVLGNRETGESDRTYFLYTKDFGLVRARARAVRSESSRMRYALQNYSYSKVSLVRGARGWRVTGAGALRPWSGEVSGVAAFARASALLMRLSGNEEKNEYLFAAIREAQGALMDRQAPRATVEIVCVARILYALGYLSDEALKSALFTHTAYTGEHLLEAETMRDKLLSSINKAIAETHL